MAKYDPVEVTEICLDIHALGLSMSEEIARHYNIPKGYAATLIAQVRARGYPIPEVKSIQLWEQERAAFVRKRRMLLD